MTFLHPEAHPPPNLTAEDLRITHLRGHFLRQVFQALEEEQGAGAWAELLASVSEESRRSFETKPGLHDWVDADHATEIILALIQRTGPGTSYRRGRDTATYQFMAINRWIIRLMSPSFLVTNIPRIYPLHVRGGFVSVEYDARKSAVANLWAHGFYPQWYELAVPGWLEAAIELTGAKGVQVRHEAPSGEGLEAYHHRYRMSWD